MALLAGVYACAQASPPLMGWSSWNTYRINIDDSLIARQADALVSTGLSDVGYRQVNIDDGFFGYRDSTGVLITHPKRFPNGLKGLVDYIHSLGLKAGIYSDAGANTCGSLWDADPNGVGVGLYGHERQDAQMYFNDLDFDFIKIDYCGAGQQLDLDEERRYTEIIDAIRSVAKKPVTVNVCRWAYPGAWVRDIADSWRTTGDISASWGSVKSIIAQNLYMAPYSSAGHYNDMDMLEIGRGLTADEEATHFGMWCMMNSPLLIGCDITNIPESSLALLKNTDLIAINQDTLGVQAEVVQANADGTYMLAKDLHERFGTERAVALYNPTDTARKMVFDFNVAELGGDVRLRDLLKQEAIGKFKDSFEVTVPAHGVRIYAAEAQSRLPKLRYEAEQAFLPEYNALGKRARGVKYARNPQASGGVAISNLGGSKENCAIWSDVLCREAGPYMFTLYYIPAEQGAREVADRRVELIVNGQPVKIDATERDRDKGVCTAQCEIDLNKGVNTIAIGSSLTWTPDIDCFTITRIEK